MEPLVVFRLYNEAAIGTERGSDVDSKSGVFYSKQSHIGFQSPSDDLAARTFFLVSRKDLRIVYSMPTVNYAFCSLLFAILGIPGLVSEVDAHWTY